MKSIFKFTVVLLLLVTSTFALDKVYFLPQDAKDAKQDILNLIENSQTKIDIAMYNFSYKKFQKALKKASKNGVDVTIIYGKTKLKFSKKIKLIQTKRKQHIKLAIIDDKFAIYGSSNWTKDSFSKNYELINITDDKKRLEEFKKLFKQLKEEN
jgi:phosphatidylserine/phosphatidylglycerophosphate/cardiolipin synthase-like enzyme